MKDALKQFSEELALELVARFESDEVKAIIESTKAASDSDTGTFEVVITTENLDRYQEVIKLDGWELDHFRKNPVVLWGHDHSRLIGMATSVEIIDGKMIAKGKFAPTEEGQEKRKLYELGFLRATSVGFIEKEREGNLITKAELLEFSFVSVPANPFALTLAMEKELSVNELVTKGIMFVEKDAPAEDEQPVEDEAPVAEEKSLDTRDLSPVIENLKAAVVALEALGTKTEEPEGDEAPTEDDPDERGLKDFSEKRRVVQEAATILGDVLAEARHAIEARRAR